MTDAVISTLRADVSTLRAEVRRLRSQRDAAWAELAFYGDAENYRRREQTWRDGNKVICGFRSPVERDGGERARRAKG